KQETRKRPTPDTPMAKLHSWVRSNSSRCGGVITFSTRSRACCGVSGLWVIGEILPLTFIDGGMPAVMNMSEAFWWAISFRKEVKSMPPVGLGVLMLAPAASVEQPLVLGVFAGVLLGHHRALHQVLEMLVEGHHAGLLAGLDGGVHLRHLVLADQVAD